MLSRKYNAEDLLNSQKLKHCFLQDDKAMDPQKYFKYFKSTNDLTPHLNLLISSPMNKLATLELQTSFH